MCGRYVLRIAAENVNHIPWREYWRDINVFVPRYNICPSEPCPLIRRRNDAIEGSALKWGFKPSWSRYNPVINARAETVLSSKMFKESVYQRRCVVIADGFYEPKGPSGERNRPWYLFEYEDGRTFGFAGIWVDDGFTIITCEANSVIAPIHERMPLILEESRWERWLDPALDETEIVQLLQAREYPGMRSRPVSNYVKKAGNEGPQCIELLASA